MAFLSLKRYINSQILFFWIATILSFIILYYSSFSTASSQVIGSTTNFTCKVSYISANDLNIFGGVSYSYEDELAEIGEIACCI